MARPDAQPVRLSKDVLAQIKEKADESGRTVPAEIEHRLVQSLKPGREFESLLSPWALAIGRIVRLLANEIGAYSAPAERAGKLKIGVTKLLDKLGAGPLKSEARSQGEDFAELLWFKLMNAHEPTTSDGIAVPATQEQRELLAIRPDLVPSHVGKEAK